MQVNASTAVTSGIQSSDSVTNSSQTLNQQDFLQLLVAQLQNQDPMNPQSNTDMAAQMAQFTSLQQASASSASLAMMQADSLVGNTVTLQVDSQTTTSGTVQGVIMQNGTPQILVNGTTYALSQVVSVEPAASNSTSTTSTPANN
jgi:flagellar basal-body rod modification protein FlgD